MLINMNCQKSAFSLVELSIVLVILGLLIGGILTGHSLIRAAELRSVVKDYEKYKMAMNVFKDRFFALPGDMKNATAFWGSAGGGGDIGDGCETAAVTGTKTCNGDGNGAVFIDTEGLHFFQHLANAGLIERNFSANPSDGILKKYPKTLAGGAWAPYTPGGSSLGNIPESSTLHFEGNYNVVLRIRLAISSNIGIAELMNIDLKIDDGKPGTGTVFTYEWDGVSFGCHDQHWNMTDPIAHLAEYTPDGSGPSGAGGSHPNAPGCTPLFRLN